MTASACAHACGTSEAELQKGSEAEPESHLEVVNYYINRSAAVIFER